jgi:hypothetical protein
VSIITGLILVILTSTLYLDSELDFDTNGPSIYLVSVLRGLSGETATEVLHVPRSVLGISIRAARYTRRIHEANSSE